MINPVVVKANNLPNGIPLTINATALDRSDFAASFTIGFLK
jgi:hypothetical protein